MKSLRPLERWDRGFESHSIAWMFVYAIILFVLSCVDSSLATAGNSSKESYRLGKKDYEIQEEARAQQRAVGTLTNE
jgi:hypothetical protein